MNCRVGLCQWASRVLLPTRRVPVRLWRALEAQGESTGVSESSPLDMPQMSAESLLNVGQSDGHGPRETPRRVVEGLASQLPRQMVRRGVLEEQGELIIQSSIHLRPVLRRLGRDVSPRSEFGPKAERACSAPIGSAKWLISPRQLGVHGTPLSRHGHHSSGMMQPFHPLA